MKVALRLFVACLTTAFGMSNLVFAAGECADNPDPCFAPRSWIEDFDEDVLVASPGDWQRRGGNSPQPTYGNGQAFFDGTQSAWTLFDSMDHYFIGTTTVKVRMDENPGGPDDTGAGWWINMDNEAIQGGFFPIFGVLARDSTGEQVYRFGQGSNSFIEEIQIAGGPMEAEVILLPPEDGLSDMMGVAYTITDSDERIYEGFFEAPSRSGTINDKWLTIFSMSAGQGVFDYIEVHNQPDDIPVSSCDFDLNGNCDIADIDQLVSGIIANSVNAAFDLNGDGNVNASDLDTWRSVAATENGFASPYLPGDSDLSGKVDAGDLNNLGLNWTQSPNTWRGGDFNADGTVDAGDLNLVGLNWQASTPLAAASSASAVPEPNASLAMLLGSIGLLIFHRRQA